MFEYFYHEILRKTIIGFGSIFNVIRIKHKNDQDQTVSLIKVPLAYGPTQKFLARLEQVPDLNKPIQITVPRMSFELNGISYDSARKVSTVQTFLTSSASNQSDKRKAYMPVPYNLYFELSIFTRLNDDMLQIVEQILPYFQPSYNLSIDLVDEIGEKRDIPIVFEGIQMQDNYEGDYSSRRVLIYTLRFTAKTYLFGPVSTSVSSDIIKKVSIGYVAGDTTKTPTREITYAVEPRATQSYTNNSITNLSQDITSDQTSINVESSSSISEGDYITIDQEEMYVKSITGNTLKVVRGSDSTIASPHVLGSVINKITQADNALIEVGDDFGFSDSIA